MHKTEIRSAGMFPSVVHARCVSDGCGWRGPDRNANDDRERVLVKLDGDEHARAGQGLADPFARFRRGLI